MHRGQIGSCRLQAAMLPNLTCQGCCREAISLCSTKQPWPTCKAMLQVPMTVVHQGRSAHPHDPVRALQGNLQLRLLLRDGFVQVSGLRAALRHQEGGITMSSCFFQQLAPELGPQCAPGHAQSCTAATATHMTTFGCRREAISPASLCSSSSRAAFTSGACLLPSTRLCMSSMSAAADKSGIGASSSVISSPGVSSLMATVVSRHLPAVSALTIGAHERN